MKEIIVRYKDDGYMAVKGGEYVQDLVRCKDCKYWIDNLTEDSDDEDYSVCRWDWERRIPSADDFCSYGERKDQ